MNRIWTVALFLSVYILMGCQNDRPTESPEQHLIDSLNKVAETEKKQGDEKTMQELQIIKNDSTLFHEGLAKVKMHGMYGFIDKEGKVVVPFKYINAGDFKDGLAFVAIENRAIGHNNDFIVYGYIDKSGKEVVPLKYDEIKSFSEGLALVAINSKYGYIDKVGKSVTPLIYGVTSSDFHEGIAAVTKGGDSKYGYIDRNGKEIIPLMYDFASNFQEGFASISINKKWGYINKTGKPLTALKYDRASNFQDGVASVGTLNGGYRGNYLNGFINTTGKEITPLKYNKASDFHEGVAVVTKIYDTMQGFEKYGYIDNTGKEIIPLIYDDAKDFHEGLAVVARLLPDFLAFGYIDKAGHEVIPVKYRLATSFNGGLAKVSINGKDVTINKMGQEQQTEQVASSGDGRIDYDLRIFKSTFDIMSKKYINEKGDQLKYNNLDGVKSLAIGYRYTMKSLMDDIKKYNNENKYKFSKSQVDELEWTYHLCDVQVQQAELDMQ